ncbi:MAG TPA: two-component regulator propeller domain-containing protein [Saprospiraceae bacterium]|nr:two-component regulator propeller domain-containing protein [Saprospiraceae bacterium]HMP24856.1 two-component regulator propeller domain-containing protein [Saprospiraceae bacterium]
MLALSKHPFFELLNYFAISCVFLLRPLLNIPSLFIFLCIIISACTGKDRNIPEPEYHPYVIEPYEYVKTDGVEVELESVLSPHYEKRTGEYVKTGTPEAYFPDSDYVKAIKPEPSSVDEETFDIGAITKLEYLEDTGRTVLPGLPKRMLAQTDNYQLSLHPFSRFSIPNTITRVMREDFRGQLWFGTNYDGIYIWNGYNLHQYDLGSGLISNFIDCFLEDSKGNLWIGTDGGLTAWNGHQFTHFLEGVHVSSLCEDNDGRLWIGTTNGIYIRDGKRFYRYMYMQSNASEQQHIIWSIIKDDNGDIIASFGRGIVVWDGGRMTHYHIKKFTRKLFKDTYNHIWIGTYENGAYYWDRKAFYHYTSQNGLSDNTIWDFMGARDGKIWMININKLIAFDGEGFMHYQNAKGLPRGFYRSLMQDRYGRIWAGGDGINGAVVWDEKGPHLLGMNSQLNNSESINTIRSINTIQIDSKGRKWVGTSNGLVLVEEHKYSRYTMKNGLLDNNIIQIFEDSKGNIWIATSKGVSVFDGEGFWNFPLGVIMFRCNRAAFIEDIDGKIWIAHCEHGLNIWDGQGFRHILRKEEYASSVFRDSRDHIWIVTKAGILKWDGHTLRRFTKEEGLPTNHPIDIMEDQYGNIWVFYVGEGYTWTYISTWDEVGFSNFKINNNVLRNYLNSARRIFFWTNEKDVKEIVYQEGKLRIEEFFQLNGIMGISRGGGIIDQKNNFWIVGRSDIIIKPLSTDTIKPQVFMQELYPFFEPVNWQQTQDTIYKGSRSRIGGDKIPIAKIKYDTILPFTNLPLNAVFPHWINHLTLSWSASSQSLHNIQYSYLLEGESNSWSPLLEDHKVSYTNLSPGSYTFKVRAVNGNGIWSDAVTYSFRIRPPWWATWWAYSLYSLLAFGVISGIYRFQLSRRLAEKDAKLAQERASYLEALNVAKNRFYENTTHEFRTPLTIILGTADLIRRAPDEWLEKGLTMIKNNGQNLLRLVRQMLDLSKLETSSLPVHLVQGDIVLYLRTLLELLRSNADDKDITLDFISKTPEIIMDYDPDKIRDIITNLLHNALKFTSGGGLVQLIVERQNSQDQPQLLITVQDNGVGIPADKLPRIFDRFYQVDDSMTRKAEGTGIGLALVKELTKLLGGDIQVRSELGQGAVFTVQLPIEHKAPRIKGLPTLESEWSAKSADSLAVATPDNSQDLPLALIAEDNRDVITYLQAHLQNEYRMEVAHNGQAGIDKAIELVPDVILSDVMMPERDGFDLCRTLKNDRRTSHIPIILITARADMESRLTGLEGGADAYLVKPFNEAELKISLRKSLELRQRLQERYAQPSISLPTSTFFSIDDAFVKELQALVAAEYSSLTVGDMAKKLYMSQPQLGRKVKALLKMSPSKYLNEYRMQIAFDLVKNTDTPIQDIAYQVGFSDPAYFSNAFFKKFKQ